jgi:hypothetical protein
MNEISVTNKIIKNKHDMDFNGTLVVRGDPASSRDKRISLVPSRLDSLSLQ